MSGSTASTNQSLVFKPGATKGASLGPRGQCLANLHSLNISAAEQTEDGDQLGNFKQFAKKAGAETGELQSSEFIMQTDQEQHFDIVPYSYVKSPMEPASL